MPRYHLRRTDREITHPDQIASIFARGKYVTIAMVHDGEPYAVTLSYGWDRERGALYFHTAAAGRKIEAIAADPRVCATIVVDGGYEQGACKHHYESVVLTGRLSVVEDADEKRHGMRVLITHLEPEPGPVWERNGLDGDVRLAGVNVLRLDIDEVTAKAGS